MSRLLSINNYHYRRGGAEAVYLDHAALMEGVGFEPAFFSMQHPDNLPTPWSEHFVDEIELGHDYPVVQRAIKATKVVYSFEAQRRLGRLLREHPVDVAHLHGIYHHLSPSILSTLKRAGVPTVMTAHDLKIACPAYRMYNREGICERCRDGSVLEVVRNRCINESLAASAVIAVESGLQRRMKAYRRHLDRIVVPSRFFGEKFVEWGWSPDAFVHIPNYVDASSYEPSDDAGRYALYFGRLSPEKGLVTLFHAAATAGVPLKVAGTGPMAAELEALAGRLDADIELLGFRSGAALHDLVRQARVVVLPSEWYENAPMSILEAMALGTPVLGARIGGIPELIDEGATGWTFESGSAPELAEALAAVASSPDADVRAAGAAGRRLVEERFHRQGYVDAMLALYASLGVRLPAAGP